MIGALLADSSEIDFTYTDATPTLTASLINGSVVFARLQNFDALSVLGRAANSAGVGDEIAAGANDRLLRRTSDTLNFGQLTAGMFPNTVVPDAALSANVALLNGANLLSGQKFTGLTVESSAPYLLLNETGVAADNAVWAVQANAEQLQWSIFSDNLATEAVWLQVDRTGTTVDSLVLAATDVQFSTGRVLVTGSTQGQIALEDAGGPSDEKRFAFRSDGGDLFGYLLNDSGSAVAAWLTVTRTTSTADSIALAATAITLNGVAASDFARLSQSNTFTGGIQTLSASGIELRLISSDATGAYMRFSTSSTARAYFGNGTLVSGGAVTDLAVRVISGSLYISGDDGATAHAIIGAARSTFNHPVNLQGYTVATLPAGAQGDVAYVTDALAPAFLTAIAGGGAVVTPVFYDGTNWVAI